MLRADLAQPERESVHQRLRGRVADGPADTVVLGELVCSRRNDFKFDDGLALARDPRDNVYSRAAWPN